jgi:hypothetical protein
VRDAVRAVFAVIAKHVAAGEAHKVAASLPAEIRALWPASAGGATLAEERRWPKTEAYGSSPFQPAARNGASGTISRVAMTGRGEVPTRNSPMMLSSR